MTLENIEHLKKQIEVLPEARAACLCYIDKDGRVTISAYGSLFQTVFMEKAMGNFNFNIMNGAEKKHLEVVK